jgi:hypothetical protein
MADVTNTVWLPETVDQVTHEWLDEVMAPSFPGRTLIHARTDQVIPGTATKILMTLVFSASATEPAIQQKVCVKGAFDPAVRGYSPGAIFAAEAAFYRDVGSKLDVALPHAFYADDDGDYGVLILEDIAEQGATFGEVTQAWDADQAAGLLRILANVHSFSWDWKPGILPWLQGGSGALRDGIRSMAAEANFETLINRPQVTDHIPAELLDRDRWMGSLQTLWERDDRQTQCLGHGDAHLGQTYLQKDGTPGLLDWQCAGLMPWAKDVAYFLGGALRVEDRRRFERTLLDGYLEALASAGGPVIDREEAWGDYRRQMLQGICWTMVTEHMQPINAITVMNERYLTAIKDLETLAIIAD